MTRRDDLRKQALTNLQESGALMLDGHFDYGNGYHGRVYLNPHRIFRQPSLIWRLAQDLIATMPDDLAASTEVVAGPVMGGALLAHTMAGLLDGRRSLSTPPTSFAPLSVDADGSMSLRPFYRSVVAGRRVLIADDVRNTGKTLERAKAVIEVAGGTVAGTVQICDRLEAIVDLGVPNFALAEYRAPENYPASACPLCRTGVPIAEF
ncbi:MAG TPA: phosphoribosyltransferase family protein [Vicinamibacterales bacterium]|jgi:orotate phosphoribosyltransferase|nr:phosphoribosyltransferase family protein [Vicinamibacterales bacterium]